VSILTFYSTYIWLQHTVYISQSYVLMGVRELTIKIYFKVCSASMYTQYNVNMDILYMYSQMKEIVFPK